MKKILIGLYISIISICAFAQNYPTAPVRIVLSIGVGSAPDAVARKIAEVLSEKWKQPVVVENRPGGAGVLGLNYINSEPANGYTLGFLDGGTVVSYAVLYKNSEPISRLEPIVPVFDANMALYASSQISNYNELKQEIIKNPSYSSWNIGSIAHLLGAQYSAALQINALHVPYKEFGTWQADVSNKQVPYAFGSTGTIKAMVQSGKNQIFGIAAAQRDPRYPNIPTIRELTGQNITTLIAWCGFYIPISIPADIKIKLEKDIREAANDRRVQEMLARFDFISLSGMSTSDFKRKIKNDQDQYKDLVTKFNIVP